MNRNFIFVFALLAMLFVVNAQLHERDTGTTTFNTCPLTCVPSLTVTIAPNPAVPRTSVSFSVFGTLKNKVTAGTTTLAVEFADSTGKKLLTDAYFQVFTESFDIGNKVTITASVLAPDELPDVYTIGVAIGNPVPGNPITPIDIFGCSYAVVGSTA